MNWRIAIFASGFGSNTENICKYFNSSSEIDVVLILSNNTNAFVLNRAKKLQIKMFTFNKYELTDYCIIQRVLKENK